MRDYCWNIYKGKGCWVKQLFGSEEYVIPADHSLQTEEEWNSSCDKSLEDCLEADRDNVGRFNSYPGVTRVG